MKLQKSGKNSVGDIVRKTVNLSKFFLRICGMSALTIVQMVRFPFALIPATFNSEEKILGEFSKGRTKKRLYRENNNENK